MELESIREWTIVLKVFLLFVIAACFGYIFEIISHRTKNKWLESLFDAEDGTYWGYLTLAWMVSVLYCFGYAMFVK